MMKKTEREEYLYHNTEKLLKKYRDIVWNVEVATMQCEEDFKKEMDCSIEEFLDMPYKVMEDLNGSTIEKQMKVLARNKKMIELLETSVNMLRKKQNGGELYYWIIYYTYLSEKKCDNTDQILDLISQKMYYISWRTYFKKKKQAIGYISTILWGFTSKDCLPIIEKLLDEGE